MAIESNITKFKDELKALIAEGEMLHASMAIELEVVDEDMEKKLRKHELPDFRKNYERWYSTSLQVIKQVLPDRIADFERQYRDEKRKQTDALTYGISDYMIGITVTHVDLSVVDGTAAIPKFMQQLNILKAAQGRLESSLFDMIEIVQADLFDNELDAAAELAKKGFLRGAGAVAGVVLERHLGHVCVKHNLKTRKKAPAINDLNQMLKDGGVLDMPMWRFIQHLADIRNLCDHNKNRDPSKEEVRDLMSGVAKVIKTLF